MNDVIIQPLLVGLSTGLFCSAYCMPFIAPYLVAEERNSRQNAGVLGKFILGRFFGYILFGAVFGYLGERMTGRMFHLFSAGALVALSVVMLLFAFGLFKPGWHLCLGDRGRSRAPILMGLLMGVNVCPPFLLSVAYVFTLHSALKGVVYFMVFFAATTVYFLPLLFLGFLGRMSEFRWVARVSAIVVGVIFCVYGIWSLVGRSTALLHTL